MILGTIHAVDDDNGLRLIIDGEDEPTTKKYSYMASYVPTANDRVIIEEISGSYVIMGKVISEKNMSGVARIADTATTANTATSAVTANTATSAAVADTLNSNNYGTTNGLIITSIHQNYNSQIGYYIDSITYDTRSNKIVVEK